MTTACGRPESHPSIHDVECIVVGAVKSAGGAPPERTILRPEGRTHIWGSVSTGRYAVVKLDASAQENRISLRMDGRSVSPREIADAFPMRDAS